MPLCLLLASPLFALPLFALMDPCEFRLTGEIHLGSERGKPCSLIVVRMGKEDPWSDFYADVKATVKHHGQEPKIIRLKPKTDTAGNEWVEEKKEDTLIRILISKDAKKLEKANAFLIQWDHGNHKHDLRCVKLKKTACE